MSLESGQGLSPDQEESYETIERKVAGLSLQFTNSPTERQIGIVLDDPQATRSFLDLKRTLMPYLNLDDRLYDKALVLARDRGLLTEEMNRNIMELLRVAYVELAHEVAKRFGREAENSQPFRPLFEQIAQTESEEVALFWSTYTQTLEQLKAFYSIDIRGLTQKEKREALLTAHELNQTKYQSEQQMPHIFSRGPAISFLHFYDNGDIRWMWDLDDQDSTKDIGVKSTGGRVGTSSGSGFHKGW